MKALAVATVPESRPTARRVSAFFPAAAAAVIAAVVAFWLTRRLPAWHTTTAVALTLFYALKIATLSDAPRGGPWCRTVGYLILWPGMGAVTFLGPSYRPTMPARAGELFAALVKVALGAGLIGAAMVLAPRWALASAVVGLAGLLMLFHFGLFHLASWGWRRIGVDAAPIMRAPLCASSLAEFWGERWNLAFAETARRFILRPFGRRWGSRRAAGFVFLVSGIVHEIAISLPARGDWGGPTVYFLIQGLAAWFEKSAVARRWRLGSGWRGRCWTLAVVGLPVPLLFHHSLCTRVVHPLLLELNRLVS